MNSKKAMGIGQVFLFIVVALTFALTIIFGYKAINNFLKKGETVEFYSFKTDLEKSIKRIYSRYGSVVIEDFYPPSRYQKICFVDMDKKPESSTCEENLSFAACDAWQTWGGEDGWKKADQNVFLEPLPPENSPPIKTYRIDLGEKGYLCLKIIKGQFRLKLEGKGDRTKISQVEKADQLN